MSTHQHGTNKDWVRQQVQRLRSETTYKSMEELAEKQRKPSYQATVHSRPQYTLDEYESIKGLSKNIDIVATITPKQNKKDSPEMEDVMAMYTVKKNNNKF